MNVQMGMPWPNQGSVWNGGGNGSQANGWHNYMAPAWQQNYGGWQQQGWNNGMRRGCTCCGDPNHYASGACLYATCPICSQRGHGLKRCPFNPFAGQSGPNYGVMGNQNMMGAQATGPVNMVNQVPTVAPVAGAGGGGQFPPSNPGVISSRPSVGVPPFVTAPGLGGNQFGTAAMSSGSGSHLTGALGIRAQFPNVKLSSAPNPSLGPEIERWT